MTEEIMMHDKIENVDLERIAEVLYRRHRYDFRDYAVSSFRRRVVRIMQIRKLTVETLIEKLTHSSPAFAQEFLNEITVNVTEMFRDPGFWNVMREEIFPAIPRNQNRFKIWHAGCSSGEEVLTMTILLKEMCILDHVQISATDINTSKLNQAKAAVYPVKAVQLSEGNYKNCQGSHSLKSYYREENGYAAFDRDLIAQVNFFQHDLVMGEIFDQVDLIVCRNVMIYFNQSLQNDVLRKLHKGLNKYGYLAMGSKESLICCDFSNRFILVNPTEKIYQKIID